MGFLNDAKKFLTGHDSAAEKKVMAQSSQIKAVIGSLDGISSKGVAQVKSNVRDAMQKLQSAKGIEYVAQIDPGHFDDLYDSVASAISGLSGKFSESYKAIEEYSTADPVDKFLASTLMAGSKFGEGILSVPEELGDGALSIVGWGAGKLGFKGAQDEIGKFIEKDWAHTAFDKLYYSTDFAKKSAFTEDSGISGAFKIGGKAVGYLYAGGLATRVGGKMLSGAKAGGKLYKLGHGALNLASGSTWGSTTAAALGGMGSGTQNGLRSGMSYDDAFNQGVKSAAIQGGTAFAAGKISEGLAKHSATKAKKAELDAAEENVGFKKADELTAKTKWRDAIKAHAKSKDLHQAYDDAVAATKEAEAARDLAEKGVEAAKDAKWSSFEGYDDVISKLGRGAEKTAAIKTAVTSGVSKVASNPIKAVAAIPKAAAAIPKAAIKNPAQTATVARESVKEIKEHNAEVMHDINKLKPSTVTKPAAPTAKPPTSISPTKKDSKIVGNTKEPDIPNTDPDIPNTDPEIPNGGGGGRPSGGGGGGGGGGKSSNASKGIAYKDPIANDTKSVTGTVDNMPSNTPTTQSVAKTSTDGIKPVTPTTDTNTTTPGTTTEARQEITTPASTTNTDTGSNITTTTGPSSVVGGSETVGTPSGGGSAYHTGGGYTESDGFTGADTVDTPTEVDTEIEDILGDTTDSIDDIIKGNKYTKIPTSSTPITHPSSGSTGSAVIPIAAGLSAAAAAGIGAKAYMDHKKNNENDDDDDFTEEWDGDENSIEVDYDNNENQENYLDEDDNYGYQETEKYDARNNEELADLQ